MCFSKLCIFFVVVFFFVLFCVFEGGGLVVVLFWVWVLVRGFYVVSFLEDVLGRILYGH